MMVRLMLLFLWALSELSDRGARPVVDAKRAAADATECGPYVVATAPTGTDSAGEEIALFPANPACDYRVRVAPPR